jgi:hypothetical protein
MTKTNSRGRYLLVLGFDYGTSATKLVLREDTQGIAAVVTNEQGHYLFPSVIGYQDRDLYAPLCDPCPHPITFLKMRAPEWAAGASGVGADASAGLSAWLEEGRAANVRTLLVWNFAYYVAVAMDFIRCRSPWPDFDETRDILFINIGVPIEQYESVTMKTLYLESLCMAYALAPCCSNLKSGNCRIDLAELEKATDSLQSSADNKRDLVSVYPEVAAGVQSVMRSPTVCDGLYATFDIGAGTLDMNAFRRHTAQGVLDLTVHPNQLNYYAAQVSEYGIGRLFGQLNRHTFEEFPHIVSALPAGIGYKPLSSEEFYSGVRSDIGNLFRSALDRQPNHGNQRGRKTWDACRVYTWGGGSYIDTYKIQLTEILKSYICPPELIQLPPPDSLQAPSEADFNRLAIAYGLSFPTANLEEIRLPKGISILVSESAPQSFLPENPGDPGYWTLDRYEG